MSVELTRLSDKGQIVIPSEIRKRMKLKEGSRFLIFEMGSTLILRKIEISEERLALKRLIANFRTKAKTAGFGERELKGLIESSRKAIK